MTYQGKEITSPATAQPNKFKLSKFEHHVLRYTRNGGLFIRQTGSDRYEYNPYDEWGGSNKFVTKYFIKRLEKNGYLQEVNLDGGLDYGQWYQNTAKANDLHWDYKNIDKPKYSY